MSAKPTVTTVSAGARYSATQLNANFEALRDAFEDILGRSGTSGTDNTMTGDLDMDGNTIRNATFDGDIAGVDWQGAWATATAYVVNDLVQQDDTTYICVTAHTSGTFATDLTAGKWELFAAGAGDLLSANNLSDIADAAVSRTNLGLGTVATKNTGTASGEVPLVGTSSSTETLAGLVEKATTAEAQAGTSADKFPDVVGVAAAIIAQTAFKVGTVTRDASSASASVAYTGVGFTPRLLIFFAAVHTGNTPSFGADDGTTRFAVYDRDPITASQWGTVTTQSIRYEPTSSNIQSAVVASMDADGFTLTWTKAGTPTGSISVNYIAIR